MSFFWTYDMRAYKSWKNWNRSTTSFSIIFSDLQTRSEKSNFTKFHNLTQNYCIKSCFMAKTNSKDWFCKLIWKSKPFQRFYDLVNKIWRFWSVKFSLNKISKLEATIEIQKCFINISQRVSKELKFQFEDLAQKKKKNWWSLEKKISIDETRWKKMFPLNLVMS